MVEIYEQEEAAIDATDILFAIKQGRGEKTEFFPRIPKDDSKLAVSACSLANNGGGQILLGVDSSGEIIGVESPDIESTIGEILFRDLERRFDTKFVTSTEKIENNTVVIIIVSGFKELPLMADGRFYCRHQSDDILLGPNEVWKFMRKKTSRDD